VSVRVFEDADALAEAAAAHFIQRIGENDRDFHLCMSGGSTPKKLYSILASASYRDVVPYQRLHFWWGDERFVPPTDPDSNEKMARDSWLDQVPAPASHIHPMYRQGTAERAAIAYERELREFLNADGFDLVLLGLGPDAHTASLFPGDPSIDEKERWVVASTGAAGVKQRLTLTPPVINAAAEVLFLVAGKDKASPLANVMDQDYDPQKYPSQIVARNARNVIWYIDSAAAAGL
jgi:6-phosphogluconolactonase